MGGHCYSCNGTGTFVHANGWEETCRKCGGTGWYERARPGETVTIARRWDKVTVNRSKSMMYGIGKAIGKGVFRGLFGQ